MATTLSLDPLSAEILLDIFRQCVLSNGLIDAVSYRVEHEDWFERLNELEQQQFLKREGDSYRVTFVVLTLLDDDDVVIERNRCESVFNILREHYKNPATRHKEKTVKELSEILQLTREQTGQTIRYFMDASSFWCAASGNRNRDDPDSAYVKPSDSIIATKTFSDLVLKVQKLFAPHMKSTSVTEILASLSVHNGPMEQKAFRDLHPGPIVTSFVYALKSDTVVRIIGRVGLAVDWTVTKEQAYSDKTRLRAYIPRIQVALNALDENEHLLVTRNLARELIRESPDVAKSLNEALSKIGWRIVDGKLATENVNVREVFFPSGAEHTAYVELRNILQSATRSIDIIDPYLDGTIFTMLKTLSKGTLHVRLLTASPPSDFKLEASNFRKEVPELNLEIRINRDFHDRFIVLDSVRCFHVGASIKDAGKRACMISQLEDGANVASLISFTQGKWSEATPL